MQNVRCWAEIDHDALRHNAQAVRQSIGKKAGLIAVVKANGYGHGAAQVAQTLVPFTEQFGVATLDEAREVRRVVLEKDILLLSPCLPHEREDAIRERFIPVVSEKSEAALYASFARQHPAPIHLCVDTGMGRIGIWQNNAVELAHEISKIKSLRVESISTHLPVADNDAHFTTMQLETWHLLTNQLLAIFPLAKFHALNSAASFQWPQYAPDRVRVGLALYGISPLPKFQKLLRPAMTFKTRITLVRDVGVGRGISYGRDFVTEKPLRVATLAVGYADGYPRQTSNHHAQVLVRGCRCPILGRITMDQMVIDVSSLPTPVDAGEEVILFGKQGAEEITVTEVADWARTIPWDILTRLGRRVKLVHDVSREGAGNGTRGGRGTRR